MTRIYKLQQWNYTAVNNGVDNFLADRKDAPAHTRGGGCCGDGGRGVAKRCVVLTLVVVLHALGQRLDLVVGIPVLSHLLTDFAVRIDDGGVVLAAELVTNLW